MSFIGNSSQHALGQSAFSAGIHGMGTSGAKSSPFREPAPFAPDPYQPSWRLIRRYRVLACLCFVLGMAICIGGVKFWDGITQYVSGEVMWMSVILLAMASCIAGMCLSFRLTGVKCPRCGHSISRNRRGPIILARAAWFRCIHCGIRIGAPGPRQRES